MNWSDEDYVKFFTRRTVTTESWSWETRAVWPWLLARVDGAGVLDIGKKGGAQAVAIITGMPIEVAAKALAELAEDGSIEHRPTAIIIPNFIEAQESRKSEAQKKKDQRERFKAQKRAQDAGIIDAPVPECPPVSPSVPLQPSPAQPSPAQLKEEEPRSSSEKPKPPVPKEPPDKFASAEAFWAYVQNHRHRAGLVAEKPPHPAKLGAFWTDVHRELGLDGLPRLDEALFRFSESKHWRSATPPVPFGAFMAQWRDFVPARN